MGTRTRRAAAGGAVGIALSVLTVTTLSAQTLQVTVPDAPAPAPGGESGGALSIAPPTGTITAGVSGSTATFTVADIEVNDTRTVGGLPGTAGWTTSVALERTTPGDNATPRGLRTSDGAAVIDGSKVTWASSNAEQHNATLGTWSTAAGVTLNGGQALDQVRDAAHKASGGYGRYRYDGTITVDLTGAAAGTYTGTLIQTVT